MKNPISKVRKLWKEFRTPPEKKYSHILRIKLLGPAIPGGGMIARSMCGWLIAGIGIKAGAKNFPKKIKKQLIAWGLEEGNETVDIHLKYTELKEGDVTFHCVDIYCNEEFAIENKKDVEKTVDEILSKDKKSLAKNPLAFGFRDFFDRGGTITAEIIPLKEKKEVVQVAQ